MTVIQCQAKQNAVADQFRIRGHPTQKPRHSLTVPSPSECPLGSISTHRPTCGDRTGQNDLIDAILDRDGTCLRRFGEDLQHFRGKPFTDRNLPQQVSGRSAAGTGFKEDPISRSQRLHRLDARQHQRVIGRAHNQNDAEGLTPEANIRTPQPGRTSPTVDFSVSQNSCGTHFKKSTRIRERQNFCRKRLT